MPESTTPEQIVPHEPTVAKHIPYALQPENKKLKWLKYILLSIILIVVLGAGAVIVYMNMQNNNTGNGQTPIAVAPSDTPTTPPATKPEEPKVPSTPGKLAYVELNSGWEFDLKGEVWIYDPVAKTRVKVADSNAAQLWSWSPDNKYLAMDIVTKKDATHFEKTLVLLNPETKEVIKTAYHDQVSVRWAQTDQLVIETAKNVSVTPNFSLDYVSVPDLTLIKSVKLTTVQGKFNADFTWEFGITPPEASEAYIYDVAAGKTLLKADLKFTETPLDGDWLTNDTLVFYNAKGLFTYDVPTKATKVAIAHTLGTKGYINQITALNSNTVAYVEINSADAIGIYTADIYKADLSAGIKAKLYSKTDSDSALPRLFAIDQSQKFLAAGQGQGVMTVLNLSDKSEKDVCESQACESMVWTHSLE